MTKRIKRNITCPACNHKWRSEILLEREARNFGKGKCGVCKRSIIKKHPLQNVCDREECIRERNRRNYRRWRVSR